MQLGQLTVPSEAASRLSAIEFGNNDGLLGDSGEKHQDSRTSLQKEIKLVRWA